MPQLSQNTVTSPTNVGKYEGVSNPYAEMPRKRTNWDKLLNWFGFRSGYDKAQEQYNLAGAEYNAQLQQIAAEDAYNSAAAVASRERGAGINPDLVGLQGEAGASFDNQQTPPDINAGDDDAWNVISGIGKSVISALTGGMAFLGDLASLKQIQIANDKQDVELGSQLIDLLNKTQPYDLEPDSTDGIVNVISNDAFARRFLGSKRNIRRFANLRLNTWDSLGRLTNEYKSYNEFADSQEKFAKTVSQPYFSSFSRIGTWDMASVLRPLQKAMFDEMNDQVNDLIHQHYKSIQQNKFEGSAYAKLNDPTSDVSQASANLAGAIDSGNIADIADNQTRSAIAPLRIDQAKIYKKMLNAINSIPDRDIGTTVMKFILTNQIFSDGGSGLKDIKSVAKVAKSLL